MIKGSTILFLKLYWPYTLSRKNAKQFLNPSVNSTDYFTSDNNNANNVVRPSRSGKPNAELLINKEITAIRLDRNAALLETLTEDLVHEGTTIPLPRDRARDTKLDTVLEEDSEEEKDNDTAKLKDDTFNTPTALEKCINLTAIVEESKDRLHF